VLCCSDSITFSDVQTDASSSPANDCKLSPSEASETIVPEVPHRPGRPPSSLQARGLIDGLTRFFTPSDRRGPRVCRELVTELRRRRHHKRRPRTSSLAESGDTVAVVPLSTFSPSEKSPGFDSETATHHPSAASHDFEDVKRLEHSSHLPLPSEEQSALQQSVAERINSSEIRQLSASCGTTMKRSREKLTDGLSQFFTAVGKRRRCSVLKHAYLSGRTSMTVSEDGTAKNSYLSDAGDVVSKSHTSCRFRTKFSPNKRVATVKLKRLPTRFAWELQQTDDNLSADEKTEIYGEISACCVLLYYRYIYVYSNVHLYWEINQRTERW